jgi:hypothetical protein
MRCLDRLALAVGFCGALAHASGTEPETESPSFKKEVETQAFLSQGSNLHPADGGWSTRGLNAGGLLGLSAGWKRLDGRLSIGGFATLYDSDPNRGGIYSFRTGGFALDDLFLRASFRPFEFSSSVMAGNFRWRTNPDAVLGGEYLSRYVAYPTAPMRDGMPWDPLDSLTTRVTGAKLSVATPAGLLRQDALILLDSHVRDPIWSYSLAYVAAVRPARWLEFGFGVEEYGKDFPSGRTYRTPASKSDTASNRFIETDAFGGDTVYFTTQGRLFSARASLDPKAWIAGGEGPGRDWTLFTEVAVLGWKNHGSVYASRWDRTAWMIGWHAPTFGRLDDLCVQWERLPLERSWLPNSMLFRNPQIPDWTVDSSGTAAATPSRTGFATITRNWRLALFASKRMWSRWDFQAWAAYRDLFRVEDPLFPKSLGMEGGLDYEMRVTGHY